MAVEAKSLPLLQLLSSQQASPDVIDVDGNTPLVVSHHKTLAIVNKAEKICLSLLELFPKTNLKLQ